MWQIMRRVIKLDAIHILDQFDIRAEELREASLMVHLWEMLRHSSYISLHLQDEIIGSYGTSYVIRILFNGMQRIGNGKATTPSNFKSFINKQTCVKLKHDPGKELIGKFRKLPM